MPPAGHRSEVHNGIQAVMAIVNSEQRINGLPVVRKVDGGRHAVALGHLVEVAHLVARVPKVGDDRAPEFSRFRL